MPTYTSNYALHQWEDTDDFLRTDFNEDFLKLDTALGTLTSDVSTAQRVGENNAYNIYNLMLQNYYEDKYTGYKKALIFDGFMDDSNIATKSSTLLHSQERLILTRTGLSTASLGYSTSAYKFNDTRSMLVESATSNGYLTGVTVKGYTLYSYSSAASVTVSVSVNGETTSMGSFSLTFPPSSSASELTLTFPTSVPVAMGDQIYIYFFTSSSEYYLYYSSTNNGVGGTMRFTAASGTSATMTSDAYALSDYTSICGWVRHSGQVTLSLVEGSSTYAATLLSTTSAVNQEGAACYESAFVLDHTPSGANTAFTLGLTLEGTQSYAELFDYGIALL